MNSRNINIAINLLIIILEIIGFLLVFNELGIASLEYYTEDSNLLLLISSSIFLILLLKNEEPPSWFKSLRFAAIVSTTLTLIIVLTVLSWTTDLGLHHLLFGGSMLYHHTLCPVLAIFAFSIEKYDKLNAIHGLCFTIIYAIIMIVLNILKIVEGPYPFLLVYNQPVIHSIMWTVVILAITYAIALILKKVNGKVII
ncbi:MAG: hypothetical protein E7Z78_00815 [Methanobrevibacter thaueri]|jgi:hypothetical protein|uniref:hypothetical protein n=1 Tax=Methanobrevibacter thaueri TaxID=190975 RepID=UPI0026F25823|nr:hypothetical protein [Methanobrevibacter thaueri]MBE6494962.1 hypothetical protein [Methanobrevibacter thaueri]